jgi:signal transduction histidine kinase
LTIARGIAEAHGGSLELRNRPEGGLEAVLALPRSDKPESFLIRNGNTLP